MATAETLLHPAKSRASLGTRILFLSGLGLLVSVPYFWLEHHTFFSVHVVQPGAVDRFLPFVPFAVWIYISLYIQLSLPLLLGCDAVRLRRMIFGFAWISIVSNLIFLFWPTAIPASSSVASNLPLRLVQLADTSGNALPSLHASLAIYCALCSAALLKSKRLRVSLWIWTILILASTLLIKRHQLVDIIAGSSMGAFAYWALFRTRPKEAAYCEAWQTTVSARKSLTHGLEGELASLLLLNWRRRVLELVSFFSLAAAGLWCSLAGWSGGRWPLLALGVVTTALALNAFVLLMHDGMHFTLFRNRTWNWLGSVLLGSTFLMSFTAYRIMHTRHHRFLGDARDPDDYQNYVHPGAVLWSLHFMRLTVGSLLYLALIPLLALKYGSDEERRRVLGEYVFLLAVYGALWHLAPGRFLLLAWLLPLLIVGTLTAIRGFTQHGITDATDPYLASRTVLPNPVIGFFLLHENFHLEHHLFPEVPSYHLPRLHRLIWKKLPRAVSSRGYLAFLTKFLRATPRMDETPIGLEHPGEGQA
ncbi:MAG TPA: fatty acid desaturase [Candidatus Angelobacter sp.]|jgi:fatty acid desaturase